MIIGWIFFYFVLGFGLGEKKKKVFILGFREFIV